ncbi:MAG: hypothetical protein AB4911_11410 [Oscillochloridaceae bacterium umkhey_bin13]
MSRADALLAKAYRRSTQRLIPAEGFLEDALAAVLEEPSVWPRLVKHLGLEQLVPLKAPFLRTQEHVETGRKDITLIWPERPPLICELKVYEPPSAHQINRYLQLGAEVISIASLPQRIRLEPGRATSYLGVVTWGQLRSLSWPEEPLVVRQLHQLIDAMGVAVPQLSLQSLTGMVTSTPVWSTLDAWSRKGIDAALASLAAAGLHCVLRDRKGQHIRIQYAWQRYGYWMWVSPRRSDSFGIFAGVFLGRPEVPLCIEGIPDLMLAVHVRPDSTLGQQLRSNEVFHTAIHTMVRP